MSFHKEISGLIKSDYAVGALYLGLASAIIADALPQPFDAFHFYYEKKNRDKFISGEITPKQYWNRNVASYFGFDTLWWLLLLGVAISVKGNVKDKLSVVGAVIGAGAVVAIIHKNIRKDEEEQELKKELAKTLEEFKNRK